MTRKHYVEFARIIADVAKEEKRTAIIMAEMVAEVAKKDNARFDRTQFLKACGLTN